MIPAMPAFSYEALDAAGRAQRGVLQADTPRGARSALRERGLTPLTVDPVAESGTPGRLAVRRRGLSTHQLALFARQLATLVGAGLPLEESLAALSEQDEAPRTRAIVAQLRARVMEGQTLASALAEFPESFDTVFRASVAAGESSGRLEQALSRLADDTEGRESLQRSLWMALAYPLLLTAVALAIAGGLLTYVVPQVVAVFQNLKQELPLATRILIAIADFVRHWGWLVALLAIAAVVAGRLSLRGAAVRAAWDGLKLRLPIAGRLVRAANTARAARTLATLVASGVPVLEAMQVAAGTVRNQPMHEALRRAALRVREGGGFARALAESGYFPPVAVRLIASGEKSGRLDAMLEQAARTQQRDVEGLLAALAAVLGPVVILAVGALVLFIVLAILLPIFELNQLVR
jgi:general secretion pathway protein F